jgi:hypothetical protein
MFDFFVKIFLKNPIGLVVFGILVSVTIGPMVYNNSDDPAWIIVGIIISVIGIVWFIMRKRKAGGAIAAYLPPYLGIVDALKNKGYEVTESEHKSDLVRTNVYLNGNRLGEVFLVAPGGKYAQFRRIEDMTEKEFQYDYSKKFKKSSGISSSYWPDNSLIGAWIEESAANCSEKGEFLLKFKNIFEEKLS